MEKKTLKIGQEIVMKENHIIRSFNGEKEIEVLKGDRAYVDGNNFIHYTSGSARGKILTTNLKVDGYDFENIAKMIFNRLNHYNLDEFLEDNEIDKKEFIEEIESALLDIL